MAIRIHCADAETADEFVETLTVGGFLAEAGVERFVGEDDDEDTVPTGRGSRRGDKQLGGRQPAALEPAEPDWEERAHV